MLAVIPVHSPAHAAKIVSHCLASASSLVRWVRHGEDASGLEKRVLSLAGLVVTFAVAYGLQKLVAYMREQLAVSTSGEIAKSIMRVQSFAALILAALILLLAWYVVWRGGRDKWTGIIFTVRACFFAFVTAVEISLEKIWLSDRMASVAFYDSYGHDVAAIALVIGIVCLLAPKRGRA